MKAWREFLMTFALAVCLTGCYRMPTDDDYCVLPMTNNPNFQHKGEGGGGASPMPAGMGKPL